MYPGVRIADIAVGGLSEAAVLELVQSRAAALAEQPVTLGIDGQTLTPRPGDLGITYDVKASVEAAMAYGLWPRVRDHLRIRASSASKRGGRHDSLVDPVQCRSVQRLS